MLPERFILVFPYDVVAALVILYCFNFYFTKDFRLSSWLLRSEISFTDIKHALFRI